MQRILSWLLLSIGTLALVCGAVVHGISRDSRSPQDRLAMRRGVEIALVGVVLAVAGTAFRKAAKQNSPYDD